MKEDKVCFNLVSIGPYFVRQTRGYSSTPMLMRVSIKRFLLKNTANLYSFPFRIFTVTVGKIKSHPFVTPQISSYFITKWRYSWGIVNLPVW